MKRIMLPQTYHTANKTRLNCIFVQVPPPDTINYITTASNTQLCMFINIHKQCLECSQGMSWMCHSITASLVMSQGQLGWEHPCTSFISLPLMAQYTCWRCHMTASHVTSWMRTVFLSQKSPVSRVYWITGNLPLRNIWGVLLRMGSSPYYILCLHSSLLASYSPLVWEQN